MKRVLMLASLAISSCFGKYMYISEIIDDLGVYVLEDTYVIKVDRAIPTMSVGSQIEFSVDNFYDYDSWDQDIRITRRVHVGTDVRMKTTSNKSELERLFSDNRRDEKKTHTREEVKRYENVTTIERFRFTPLGLLQGYVFDLVDFELFLNSQVDVPPLLTYTSMDLDHGYIWTASRPQRTNFAGEGETVWWVLDHMKTYTSDFQQTIRPILHKKNTNMLAGVLTHAVSYGWIMRDFEAHGLALLENPYAY